MCETPWSKDVGVKRLGPKNVFSIKSWCEMPLSKTLAYETSWSEKSSAKRPVPKCPGMKRPGLERLGAKRPGPKSPCVKHAARFSHFVKLKSMKYHFNEVERKSGIIVTKTVDVVF